MEPFPYQRIVVVGTTSSGKSTLAKVVMAKIQEANQRIVTLLDGDIIRKHLSTNLGFSKEDRNTNIQRIGFVSSIITQHQGIAICAVIAPYETIRQSVRKLISSYGGFIEIYLTTPIEICKQRDVKGLYKKAEMGLISDFTGVNDPYEIPSNPELIIDTSKVSIIDAVESIFSKIEKLGYSWRHATP